MKRSLMLRISALCLCLCLLVGSALAEGTYLSDNEVTHSDFTLDFSLHADAFPQSTAHVADWETFLNKLSLRGEADVLDLLQQESRVYWNGALCLNGKDQIPFVYDGYHSYRYFISPLLRGDSMHFQMSNFFEFMLKPYNYMELPTQYLALALYPEATVYIAQAYYAPVAEAIAAAEPAEQAADAEASPLLQTQQTAPVGQAVTRRRVPYETLYELCETLNLLVNDDYDERVYFYLACLLSETYAVDSTVDALSYLEDWLDFLDPEQNGLLITEDGDTETMVIGETTVFTRTQSGEATAFTLTLPSADGYTLTLEYSWTPEAIGATLEAALDISLEGESHVHITARGEGLPREGELSGQGRVTLDATGSAFTAAPSAQTFTFDWVKDAPEKPCNLDLKVDWLHPATGLPAVSARFRGSLEKVDKSVFVEAEYPQDDFFNLNEGFMEEYKQRYLPSIALSMVPILLETPTGVIDDVMKFCQDKDILLSLGLE